MDLNLDFFVWCLH